jgi:CDP-glucose 4,6-dehydratase
MEGVVKTMSLHNFYKDKKVFITGHTGFKGSWLALWLQEIGAEVAGYSLPAEEISHFNLLKLKSKNYFENINDQKRIERAIQEFKPDIVFHLAAQPLVRDSYNDPITTYDTNVTGSLKVYLAALKANVPAVVSITTDKVYDNKEWSKGYVENDQLGGHDPYSSSKACMEIMTESFRKSFSSSGEILIATARAGNVVGGGDWARDRLIPDLVRNASQKKITPMRNPQSVRPWQHVLEPLNGYLLLGEKLLRGQSEFATAYNFGPNLNDNITVLDVANFAKKSWSDINFKMESSQDQLHEAGLLKLDISKAQNELKWKPLWKAEEAITFTVNWYKEYYLEKKISTHDDLRRFIGNEIIF